MTEAGSEGAARWASEPFIEGTPEQYRQLRDWLTGIGFTEEAICSAAGVSAIAQLKMLEAGRTVFGKPDDARSLLVQLFLDSVKLPWTVVDAALSPSERALLMDLGMLRPSIADPSVCAATIALAPVEDMYVVSDRLKDIEKIGEGLPSDLVYSPLTTETHRFIELMPRTPCEDYLEMCAGTGIAALLAAKGFAKHAYSADITARSTRFARFNAALNGLSNFTSVEGDLYEPVAGKTFDVISAHPPYVPAETTEMVFRDGGADGEHITRRIIAGLEEHLRPGGLFYLDCVMTDRTNDAIEHRVRRMLGPSEDEFDVLVVRSGEVDTKLYQADRLRSGRTSPEAFRRQAELFKNMGIERLVAVSTIVQRRRDRRSVFTRRRTLSAETTADDLVWMTRYLSGTSDWGVDETRQLLDSRPRAMPDVRIRVRSALRDGEWKPIETRVETTAPFSTDSPCPPWFPTMLTRCDGRATVRELYDGLLAEGALPADTLADDFAQMIRELAEVPFIELEHVVPVPARRQRKTPNLA